MKKHASQKRLLLHFQEQLLAYLRRNSIIMETKYEESPAISSSTGAKTKLYSSSGEIAAEVT